MPVIPTFDVPTQQPGVAPAPRIDPTGASAPGQALSTAAGQVTNSLEQWNARYDQAKRQADAANSIAAGVAQLGDAQFRWSKTPDNKAAYDGFMAEAGQIQQKILGGINDPLVAAHVQASLAEMAISRGLATRQTAFGVESSQQLGNLDQRLMQYSQAAATAPNDIIRAQTIDMATADIKSAVQAGWMAPEAGAKAQLGFASRVDEVQARQLINNNPRAAVAALSDPSVLPRLDPDKREILLGRATHAWNTEVTRGAAATAHADAVAERNWKIVQGGNTAMILADVLNGKGDNYTPDMLASMVKGQALSEPQMQAIIAARTRQNEGSDNPSVAIYLQQQLEKRALTYDQVADAQAKGYLKTSTAMQMIQAIGQKTNAVGTEIEKQAFDTVKTALGGHSVEKGIVDLTNEAGRAQQARWAEAQAEWTRRVVIGQEGPQAVRDDMLARYATPPNTPAAWPKPRFGAVNKPEDIAPVWEATRRAQEAGRISAGELQAQAELLARYQSYYAALTTRTTAPPPSPGGGAKVRGLTP